MESSAFLVQMHILVKAYSSLLFYAAEIIASLSLSLSFCFIFILHFVIRRVIFSLP